MTVAGKGSIPSESVINAPKKGRLTAAFVRSVNRPGVYCDQHGLRLRVHESRKLKSISKQWVWRGTINGTRRDVGLGAFPYISLAEASQKAFEYRKISWAGGDPLALKRKPDVPTFAEAVETVIAIHREGWKDAGTSEKLWRASLRDYAMKRLGRRRVDQIATADVMAVLIPHWHTKTETMRRVRQRIGAVMKWAVARGYRDDNPAGDAISAALPKTGTMRKNQRALPFADVGAALDRVKASGAFKSTVLALEFLVLTATRSGEVRLATWDEVDLGSETWTVPASRMKAKRDHRVPLPARALEILHEARELSGGSGLVFPSAHGRALSDNTISKLLRELGIEAVPHGFRSSFRGWAAECSDAPREVCELALAHVNSNRVEAAYRRTDLFERRRVLMEESSSYIGRSVENVNLVSVGVMPERGDYRLLVSGRDLSVFTKILI